MTESEPAAEAIHDESLNYEIPLSFRPGMALTLGTVGLRLIAIYLLMIGAAALPQVLLAWTAFTGVGTFASQRWVSLTYLIYPLCHGVLGWWLCAKSGRLALRWFASVPDQGSAGADVTARQIATLFVAAVGLLAIILSLPQIVTSAFSMATGQYGNASQYPYGRGGATAYYYFTTIGFFLSAIIQPAAGFYLLLRADRVSRIFSAYTTSK